MKFVIHVICNSNYSKACRINWEVGVKPIQLLLCFYLMPVALETATRWKYENNKTWRFPAVDAKSISRAGQCCSSSLRKGTEAQRPEETCPNDSVPCSVTVMLWAFDFQPLKYLQDVTDCQWKGGEGVRTSFAKGMMIK